MAINEGLKCAESLVKNFYHNVQESDTSLCPKYPKRLYFNGVLYGTRKHNPS